MDFNSNTAPIIHVAPEHKPVKVPKRPSKPELRFYAMTNDELMAFMASTLRFKYDPTQYKLDQSYKSKTDAIMFMGMVAMMTHYLRSQGVNTEKLIGNEIHKII